MENVVVQTPYLFFDRTAAEAMSFYKSVLGGELATTTRGSVDPSAPEDMKELLIHAELSGGLAHIMGADSIEIGSGAQPRVAISLSGTDEDTMRKVYDGLAAGGSADHPLKKEFWGDTFGGLTDKYGINWLINIVAAKPAEAN